MGAILDRINAPNDLKKLTPKELSVLADELRKEIIAIVAKNGGHLASNLGVVELTLALHSIFNSPDDKIVWDVGHQSYVHKLLTGRKEQFSTIRQWGGISGFPKPEESPHDVFATGHSSTSISAALGLAKARDLKGGHYHIAAVIGDGSMTGGMAFEALNHAGHMKTDLVVILNDNEMSIDPNVGALSGYLSRLRMHPRIHHLKETIQDVLSKVPRLGKPAVRYLEKIKDSLTYLFIPGIIFEELGFTYFGPIDGHNIALLKLTIQDALVRGGPVLIHVTTRKGKGYLPAEQDPARFHSTAPFEIETDTTTVTPGVRTYTEIFGETLVDIGQKEPRLVAITAAMTEGTGLTAFATTFPERFIDVGIAEPHAVTMAAGLARSGLQPVVAVYSTFLQRAYDQVLHDVCMQKLPVVFCLDRAGVVGKDGPTHHGVFDLAYLRHLPNMVIMAPKDENEFRQMIWTALQHDGPVTIRYPRGEGMGIPLVPELQAIPLGQGELLADGEDALIIALGNMVEPARRAVERLANKRISCALLNPRFVKPLDQKLIMEMVAKTRRVITVEDHILAGGFGSSILEMLSESALPDIHIERLGYPDAFLPQGSITQLHQAYGLTEEGIYNAVSSMIIPTLKAKGRR